MTGELCEANARQLLPPTLRSGGAVMDNLSSHKRAGWRRGSGRAPAAAAAASRPGHNLIELALGKLKAQGP